MSDAGQRFLLKPNFEHPMTVRQVFYQATVRGLIPKTENGYQRIASALGQMRRDGMLPFSWLTDHTRWRRMDTAVDPNWEQKAARRLADFAPPVEVAIMNRWRQRLTEIDRDSAVMQVVQNVQNVQNTPPSRHFVQIEQIEQRPDSFAPPLPALDSETPDDWRERLREVLSIPCPEDMPTERWACACRGVEQFARGWAAIAMRLGWTFEELFGLTEPFANVSLQGAAWFVGDSTVTAVTADAITLRTERGATQRIYRKPRA
jgi:hypothetical protein